MFEDFGDDVEEFAHMTPVEGVIGRWIVDRGSNVSSIGDSSDIDCVKCARPTKTPQQRLYSSSLIPNEHEPIFFS